MLGLRFLFLSVISVCAMNCSLNHILTEYNNQLHSVLGTTSKMIVYNTDLWVGFPSYNITSKLKQRHIDHMSKITKHWVKNEAILYNMFEKCSSGNVNNDTNRFSGYTSSIQIFTHIHRDWTVESSSIREQIYRPILDTLSCIDKKLNVMVPGSGLGRLAFEISRLGHDVIAVEYSPIMSIAAQYILNHLNTTKIFYPYLYQQSRNAFSNDDYFEASIYPDNEYMISVEKNGSIHLETGDFIEFSKRVSNVFDVVATSFFIDTASNTIDYLWAIRRILKNGGLWINVGPLHYHMGANKGGVYYSLEDLFSIFEEFGMIVMNNFTIYNVPYIPDTKIWMSQSYYNPIFFVVKVEK